MSGRKCTEEAAATPGLDLTSSRIRPRYAERRVASPNCAGANHKFMLRTRSVRNPGSTATSFWKLRSTRPAPARRTRARATWVATNDARSLWPAATPARTDAA